MRRRRIGIRLLFYNLPKPIENEVDSCTQTDIILDGPWRASTRLCIHWASFGGEDIDLEKTSLVRQFHEPIGLSLENIE